ncbi:MAG: hypothetical protein WCK89_16785 [bacterium]
MSESRTSTWRGTRTAVQCLTGGQDYWFAVDGFNDSGVTFGAAMAPVPKP